MIVAVITEIFMNFALYFKMKKRIHIQSIVPTASSTKAMASLPDNSRPIVYPPQVFQASPTPGSFLPRWPMNGHTALPA